MSRHILVVEDNISTRELYVDILGTYDFTVEVLLNGQEVIDYFDVPENPRPDLLLLDINLPEKNGVYVLKYLRGKLKLHKQKILVITANHIAGQLPEMELADQIMTKPFLPKQLKETIEQVLAAPSKEFNVKATGETEPIVSITETPTESAEKPEATAEKVNVEVVSAETRETEIVDLTSETDEAERAAIESAADSIEDTGAVDPHKADTVETRAVKPIVDEAVEAETTEAEPQDNSAVQSEAVTQSETDVEEKAS